MDRKSLHRIIPFDNAEDLLLHKQRLVKTAQSIDPLAPLRHHPALTVCYAATLGVVAASPAAAEVVQTAVTSSFKRRLAQILGGQAAQLLHQYFSPAAASTPPAK